MVMQVCIYSKDGWRADGTLCRTAGAEVVQVSSRAACTLLPGRRKPRFHSGVLRRRYQYDPNPRVRDGMTNIWRVLVEEPRKAVDAHFDVILPELLREMGGRLWRNREAAALALSDLLQGRRWQDVKSRFEEIWTMAFRTLDDIKARFSPCFSALNKEACCAHRSVPHALLAGCCEAERFWLSWDRLMMALYWQESVRSAATGLIRTLRGLTLRLADPQYTPTAEATAAISVTLPFLLKSGAFLAVLPLALCCGWFSVLHLPGTRL